MISLSTRQLNRATLARQMLLARHRMPALRAFERLVGVQAQWPRPPFIALWSRLTDFRADELTGLLHRREVVRATLMRATIHLMTAADYLRFRSTLQAALSRGAESLLGDRLAGAEMDRMLAVAREFFTKESRTFAELRAFLLTLDPAMDERAVAYAVRTHLPLVQVPTDAQWGHPATADFADAEAWLGKPVPQSIDRLGELVIRYLAALGPSTVADMQSWLGVPKLAPVVERLEEQLVRVRDERGKEHFDVPDAPRPPAETVAPVRFLPEFDNVLVARSDERFLARKHRPLVFLSALRVRPTVLVDGFVAAAWGIARAKGTATLTVEPFARLQKRDREEVGAEAERLLEFTDGDAKKRSVKIK